MKQVPAQRLPRKVFLAKNLSDLARARVPKETWLGIYEDTPESKLLCVGHPGRALALRVKERCYGWPVVVRCAQTKEELLHEDLRIFGWRPNHPLLRPRRWIGRSTRGRKRKPPVLQPCVYLPPTNPSPWEASLAERGALYDVLYWFSHDPGRCVDNPRARTVLRRYVSPFPQWIKPASAAGKKTQYGPWWEALRDAIGDLALGIPETVRDRYADYLTGFILVCEEQQERDTSAWRAFVRSETLKEIGIVAAGSCSATPARKEHLKTVLCKLMTDDAVIECHKSYLVPGRILTPVWALVGEQIKPESLAREIRRSRARQRTSRPH